MKKEDIKIGQKVMINYGACKGEIGEIKRIETNKVYLGDELGYWFYDSIDPLDPLECLEEGEILVDKSGDYHKVLAKVGGSGETTCYALSNWASELNVVSLEEFGKIMTVFTMKKWGYKPYHPEAEETKEEVKEITAKEVSEFVSENIITYFEALGKNVKIKKD